MLDLSVLPDSATLEADTATVACTQCSWSVCSGVPGNRRRCRGLWRAAFVSCCSGNCSERCCSAFETCEAVCAIKRRKVKWLSAVWSTSLLQGSVSLNWKTLSPGFNFQNEMSLGKVMQEAADTQWVCKDENRNSWGHCNHHCKDFGQIVK